MLPLRYARRWQLASVILLLVVFAATLVPAFWVWPNRRELVSWLFDTDKWLHALAFFVLALWFAGQYRPRSYWRVAIGLMAFGLLIEASQRMVAYRMSEWWDVVADGVGIAVGLGLALAGLGGWSLRVEQWYARRSAAAHTDT